MIGFVKRNRTSHFVFIVLNVIFSACRSVCAADLTPTPAVVNPAIVSPFQRVVSLRGAWDFATCAPWNAEEPPTTPSDLRSIQVPGCWEAQGVGEPGPSQPWDCVWDCNPRPLRHLYMGAAYYRKTLEIPSDWNGSEIWLKVGGVRTEAIFWIDGRRVGTIDAFCGTYKFRITEWVEPGKTAQIVAIVRNDTPSRKGQMCDSHKFGGFYRDVELEATPKTWLDDVWVQGRINDDYQTKTARVHFTLDSTDAAPDVETLKISIEDVDGNRVAETSWNGCVRPGVEEVVELPNLDVENWEPESPTLYVAKIETTNSDGSKHGWVERFGFRRLEVRGDRFFLNGRPYFLRGYGETFVYPKTLVSPADRDVHRKNLAVVRACGFELARQHTHCEIPEYFEAADEAGVMIQPELPYYRDCPTESFEFDPMRDLLELYRHYRRYVSFAVYSMGNEGLVGSPIDETLYQWCKKNDPDRIVQHQDGGVCTEKNSDFVTSRDGSNASLILPWAPGTFDDLTVPYMAHEYMNQSVALDPRLEPKFDGATIPLVSLDVYRNTLKKFGLTRFQGDACIRSAHFLQAFYNKEGLENARRDPTCDGYSFWNFIDQMVIQNGVYTSQGCLNAFYEQKDGGCPIDEFREFNGQTVALARFESELPIFAAGDEMRVSWTIAHFGVETLPNGKFDWSIRKADSKNDANAVLAQGSVDFESLAPGDVRVAARFDWTVPELAKPGAWTLTAQISGTEIKNHWNFWTFPTRVRPTLKNVFVSPALKEAFEMFYDGSFNYDESAFDANPDALLVASPEEDIARKALDSGRRVLAIRPATGAPNVALGWWSFGNQLGTATFAHSAFGDFPRAESISPLWFATIKDDNREVVPEEGLFDDWEPLVLGDGLYSYSVYMIAAKAPNRRAVQTFGLDLLQNRPETLYLLDSLVQYCAGN